MPPPEAQALPLLQLGRGLRLSRARRSDPETTPPDGDHIYARTKAIGEAMLAEYSDDFPSVIVRFAALFSDWCEYAPLYVLLRSWLSRAWKGRIVAGHGESAVPYLHVKDAVGFIGHLLTRVDELDDGEIVIASPDGSVSHGELFTISTTYENEDAKPPRYLPRLLVWPGLRVLELGRALHGQRAVREALDGQVHRSEDDRGCLPHASAARLGAARAPGCSVPHPLSHRELQVRPRRVDSAKRRRDATGLHRSDAENPLAAGPSTETRSRRLRGGLGAGGGNSGGPSDGSERDWDHDQIMRSLHNAIRLEVKADFLTYCRELAERRLKQGDDGHELIAALTTLNQACLKVLHEDPEAEDILPYVPAHVTMTIQFGIDQVRDKMDEIRSIQRASRSDTPALGELATSSEFPPPT